MHIRQDVSELIGSIYEGPLEDSPWQSFLELLRPCLSANVATLVLRPPSESGQGLVLNAGGNDREIRAYNTLHYGLDPFVDLPEGEVISLHEHLDRSALEHSDFYRLVMEPSGLYDFLGADIALEQGHSVRLRVGRVKGAKPFGKSHRALLSALLPHLRRSLLLFARLSSLESERAVFAGAIEQLSVGSILLNREGGLMSANTLAETLLQEGDGLSLQGGQLKASFAADQKRLGEVMGRLLDEAPAMAEALALARPSGRADLGVVLRPLAAIEHDAAAPALVLFISDPEQRTAAPREVIQGLFGFTQAESALTMLLVNGLSLDEAAAELGVSRNTARTHLRGAFAKTGVSRQTQLVSLVLKSVASLG